LERLRGLRWPLPSHRVVFEDNDPRQPIYDQVLGEEGLTTDQLKLKGLREMFFTRGDRPALCLPANLDYRADTDETRPGKRKLQLAFELPRGSYATLVIKRLTAEKISD
jgi:tRNA pseudouridine13 synthase